MRTLAILFTALLTVVGLGIGAGGCVVEDAVEGRLAAERELADQWARTEARVRADWERWKDDALFVPRDGGDAAPLLFQFLRWSPSDAGASFIPQALSERLRSYDGGWAAHADELEVRDVELGWMRELSTFGYWDIEPPDGPLRDEPLQPFTSYAPSYVDLQNIARVRIVQGLQAGDARQAAREVRELARLCMSAEHVAAELTALNLLAIERRGHEQAAARGHDLAGWQPYSARDADQIRAALRAAQAPFTLLATEPLASVRPPIGACAGLRAGAGFAGWLQALAADLLPERYAALVRTLEESPCRLRRLRAFWANPVPVGQLELDAQALCLEPDGTRAPRCNPPAWLAWMPLVRPFVANRVLTSRRTVDELGDYLADAGR